LDLRAATLATLILSPGWIPDSNAQDDVDDEVVVEEDTLKCISSRRIRRIRIVDDQNVLIYLNGTAIYHNRLRTACGGLARIGTFAYNSNDGLLCEGDGIAPLAGEVWGDVRPVPSCWLGLHRKIDREEADALRGIGQREATIEPVALPMPEPSEVSGEEKDPEG